MKFLKLSLIGVIFFLTSCESETIVYYYLKNNSSETILVSGKNVISNATIELSISPNTTQELGTWSKLGKETDVFTAESIFGTDLKIQNSENTDCNKDYLNQDNWSIELDDQRFVATHNYTFQVSDTDF